MFLKLLERLTTRRCPACGRKALESHLPKVVKETAMLVNPEFFYAGCVRCGARFKQKHHGRHRPLLPVTDEEWERDVWVRPEK